MTVQEGRGGHLRVCRPILYLYIYLAGPCGPAGTAISGRTRGYVVTITKCTYNIHREISDRVCAVHLFHATQSSDPINTIRAQTRQSKLIAISQISTARCYAGGALLPPSFLPESWLTCNMIDHVSLKRLRRATEYDEASYHPRKHVLARLRTPQFPTCFMRLCCTRSACSRSIFKPLTDHLTQTACDLFGRTDEPPLPLLPLVNMCSGERVEICGEPGTGKTALLMECVLRCIMPKEVDGHVLDAGWQGATCIVIDTEGGFSVPKLSATLNARLRHLGSERAKLEGRQCLRRLHIMRATTRREVVAGLATVILRKRRSKPEDTPTPLHNASLLLIDRCTLVSVQCSLSLPQPTSFLPRPSRVDAQPPLSHQWHDLHDSYQPHQPHQPHHPHSHHPHPHHPHQLHHPYPPPQPTQPPPAPPTLAL